MICFKTNTIDADVWSGYLQMWIDARIYFIMEF